MNNQSTVEVAHRQHTYKKPLYEQHLHEDSLHEDSLYEASLYERATYKVDSYTQASRRRIIAKEQSGIVIKTDGRRRRQSFCLNSGLFKISFVIFVVAFICVAGILNITAEGSERLAEKQYKSIQIEEGDTLWSIAIEYNDEALSKNSTEDYIEDVMSINNLVRDDKITVGSFIIVPIYVMAN